MILGFLLKNFECVLIFCRKTRDDFGGFGVRHLKSVGCEDYPGRSYDVLRCVPAAGVQKLFRVIPQLVILPIPSGK